MEVLSTICIVLCCLCLLAVAISLLIWIILRITKSSQSKHAMHVFLFSLLGIVVFFLIALVVSPSCDHNWTITENIQTTCTENGRVVKYCTLCNKQEINENQAFGHTWIETTKEPTCVEPGEHFMKCSICGTETTEVLIAQHDYIENVLSTPTCESAGQIRYTCSVCGDIKETDISATGHSWTGTTDTKPKTCSICGISDPGFVEILFREIPWGTTSENAAELIKNENVSASIQILEEAFILFPEELLDPYSLNGINAGGNVLYAYNLTAGGYKVEMAQLHFLYNIKNNLIDRNNDSFYAAAYYLDVVDHEAVYNDLHQKMTDIYGVGKEKTGQQSGVIASLDYTGMYTHTVKRTTWYGANDTFVILQWISDDNQAKPVQDSCGVSIVYGKHNLDSSLLEIEKALNQEKANADKENAKGNSEGL